MDTFIVGFHQTFFLCLQQIFLPMILLTHLKLRVTGFRLTGHSCQKGQHGLTHLCHARDQFGFCGVRILKLEKKRERIINKAEIT